MRLLQYLVFLILPSYIIGFVSGYSYLKNQDEYTQGYDKGMCAIVKTVTGQDRCEVRELPTMSGGTTRAAISLPY